LGERFFPLSISSAPSPPLHANGGTDARSRRPRLWFSTAGAPGFRVYQALSGGALLAAPPQ
jgi:hypothetical protein